MDYNDILNSLPISIYRVDREGKITYINETIRQQIGLPFEQILGKTAYDFYPEKLAEKYRNDDLKVINHKVEFRTIEEHWIESTETMTYVEVIKQPILDEEDNCVGIQGIYTDVSEVREKLIEAERKAVTDPLTELPNRKAIELYLSQHLAKTKRNNYCFTLIFLDVNDFKQINDTHGHLVGDHVLVELSQRLLRVTRGNDVVGRFAGDEFVLILDETGDKSTFSDWQQRADLEIKKPIKLPNSVVEISLSVSMGVCLCPQKKLTTIDDILNEADMMMYAAKRSKSESYCISGY